MSPPAAAAAPAVQPRRPAVPRGPRRVSGPARPRVVDRPSRASGAEADAGLVLGLIAALGGLAQHRLLDRLIRGRLWIGLLAFALIGIVALQLGLLKLNGGIGRALEHEALLQRENATLSIENSELAAGERVEQQASHLGMAFVPSGALRFLAARPGGDAAKAAAALSSSSQRSSTGDEQASGTGSGESSSGTESAGGGESSASEPSASQSSGESESSSGESASTPSESQSSSGRSEESSTAGAESTAAGSSPPASESAERPAEDTPAGGTQASSAGE
jgi:hypothetical protein